jgi:L-fucose isomerase-like protein
MNLTLGVILGNRGFFPDHLCDAGRTQILATLEQLGIGAVILPVDASKYGSVESNEDARKCAELFRSQAGKLDGVLVTLPNFGDERGVANALRWSGLTVPVLVHAFADDPLKMTIRDRRDSFCGKMSVCNNLRQYGVRFTLTRRHTCAPDAPDFLEDLRDFAVTCRVVRGLRKHCGLARWARGRRPSTPCGTARNSSSNRGSASRPWTFTSCSAGSGRWGMTTPRCKPSWARSRRMWRPRACRRRR